MYTASLSWTTENEGTGRGLFLSVVIALGKIAEIYSITWMKKISLCLVILPIYRELHFRHIGEFYMFYYILCLVTTDCDNMTI